MKSIQPFFLVTGIAILFFLQFFPCSIKAQISDNFSDGNFSQNPRWQGDSMLFQINSFSQLQTDGLSNSDTIYLATENTHLGLTEWRFDIDYDHAPSSTNNLRVYLVADQVDLKGPIHGYYLQIGESGSDDSFDLWRQDGNQSTLLVDGANGRAANHIHATVKNHEGLHRNLGSINRSRKIWYFYPRRKYN